MTRNIREKVQPITKRVFCDISQHHPPSSLYARDRSTGERKTGAKQTQRPSGTLVDLRYVRKKTKRQVSPTQLKANAVTHQTTCQRLASRPIPHARVPKTAKPGPQRKHARAQPHPAPTKASCIGQRTRQPPPKQTHQLRVGVVSHPEEVGGKVCHPCLHHGRLPVVAEHRLLRVETHYPLVRVDRHQNRPHTGVNLPRHVVMLYKRDRCHVMPCIVSRHVMVVTAFCRAKHKKTCPQEHKHYNKKMACRVSIRFAPCPKAAHVCP